MPSSDVADAIALAYGGAPQKPMDTVADAIAQAYAPAQAAPAAAPAAPVPAGQSFTHGMGDLEFGLGQAAEHVPGISQITDGTRWLIRKSLQASGHPDAAALFDPVSSSDFDQIVRQREQTYQQARQAAGQTGIDWWRLAGDTANPLNYLIPGGAAEGVAGRIGQAAMQGGAISAAQPSMTPGSFWWDKAKGFAVGTASGALTGGVIEGAMPAIKGTFNAAKNALGGARQAAASPAAEVIVNDALKARGTDPAALNLNVLAGMKQEVQSALDHDAAPSAEAIANRARAESLPVPVRLMRGQATGDPAAFSAEQNLRGITGVGEPITQRLQQQNAAFIQNLDALGAKNATDSVSTSMQIADKVQGFWDALQAKKSALYDAVRNSQGQPAMMDQFTAVQNIHDALDTPQASHAYDLLPGHIRATLDDLQDGKLPLTVAQMQALDKTWGADARSADGSTAFAINTARRMLNEAPIQDDVGDQARQAYFAARQAHAQQMSLVDPKLPNGMPNPKFQPIVKSVVIDGKPPETLFQQHFMGAAPSVAGKNLAFLSKLDPDAPQAIGQTLMGEIKRQALSSASDERGTVSQSVLIGWANDPVKSARLAALMPKPAVDTFNNLAATVEAAKRFPVAATVNTSNTGSAVVNAGVSMLKNGAAAQIAKRLPIIKQLVSPITEGLKAAKTQTAVNEALSPGVTLKSMLSTTPSQAARRGFASRLIVPGAMAAASVSNSAQEQ